MPLTVVTGLTSSRLEQLQHQCASWKGPLSAAVYIVVKGDGKGGMSEEGEKALAAAAANVAAFHARWAAAPCGAPLAARHAPHGAWRMLHVACMAVTAACCIVHACRVRCAWHGSARGRARNLALTAPRPLLIARRTEAAGGCQLDVSLLYEVVAEDVMTLLLPINVMRNYALLQVRPGAGIVGVRLSRGRKALLEAQTPPRSRGSSRPETLPERGLQHDRPCLAAPGPPLSPRPRPIVPRRRRARGWWR